MNTALVDGIVKAVLYEGYMLYPYRPSAVKNQQRFNFGVVYPRDYCNANEGTEACTMQTECLVQGTEETLCEVRIRFLRMVDRSIGKVVGLPDDLSAGPVNEFDKIERLEANGKVYRPWQEAVEEEVAVPMFVLSAMSTSVMSFPFELSAGQEEEPIRDENNLVVGMIERRKRHISGVINLSVNNLASNIFKLSTRISNESHITNSDSVTREEALTYSLVSAHTILEVSDGEFISLIDPPDAYRDFALACQNIGTWPVLVGQENRHNTMLSSPIILYDYPQIAPESPGDLFDGAEIDEILSLRIMTMTDEEKQEMRDSDERARQILERTELLPEEHLKKLHGAVRGLRPVKGDTR